MSDRMAWTTPYNTMAEYNSRIEEVEHQPNQPKTIIKLTDGRVEIIPTQQKKPISMQSIKVLLIKDGIFNSIEIHKIKLR